MSSSKCLDISAKSKQGKSRTNIMDNPDAFDWLATGEFLIFDSSRRLLCVPPLSCTPQIILPLTEQHDVPLGTTLIRPRGSDLSPAELCADIVDRFPGR